MAKRKTKQRKKASVLARAKQRSSTTTAGTHLSIPEGVEILSKIEAGSSRWRIVPYIAGKGNPFADEGMQAWERTYWVHRGIGPNKDSIVCLAKTVKKPCPICQMVANLAEEDYEGNKKTIKDLKAKERQLMYVVNMDDSKKKPKLFDYSSYGFGNVLMAEIENSCDEGEEDLYENFADPKSGMLIKVLWEANPEMNNWCSASSISLKPSKVALKVDPEKLPCLDDMLVLLEAKSIKALLLELDEDVEEEEEEEVDEDIEDEEEDEEDEEDEDEDEDEDEEEEDEEEEDEDEEEEEEDEWDDEEEEDEWDDEDED